MTEETVDAMCDQLGEGRPSRTAEEPLPDSDPGETYQLGSRLHRAEERLLDEQLICECELIGRGRLEETMGRRGTDSLDDIRRSLRLGMGPCQGGFCIYRAAGILHGGRTLPGDEANHSLLQFLEERWKGDLPILYGAQLRQALFDEWVF